MIALPSDVARCPGQGLVDMRALHVVTDARCDGCARLEAGREATSQWISDGRPRVEGGAPSMPVAWMPAPRRSDPSDELFPCAARIEG